MLSGKITSLTSTAVTLTPHGSVYRSMISGSLRFILSRWESSSSGSACLSTLRNVACEKFLKTVEPGLHFKLHLESTQFPWCRPGDNRNSSSPDFLAPFLFSLGFVHF